MGTPQPKERDKPKKKVWKTTYADKMFSKFITQRDGKCLRCSTTDNLTNSHYWRRGHSGTRFHPDNCITLCHTCHSEWENLKNYDYKVFMLVRLGEDNYNAVERLARTFKNRGEAVMECMELLKAKRNKV